MATTRKNRETKTLESDHKDSEVQGFHAFNTSEFGNKNMVHQEIITGIEFYRRTGRHSRGGKRLGEEKNDSLSFYLEDRISFRDKLFIIPGLRYDIYKSRLKKVKYDLKHLSPALAVRYAIIPDLTVFTSYTGLFRGPRQDLEVLARSFQKNNALKPETGSNWEIGFKFDRKNIFQDRDGFSFSARYFKTKIKNYFEREWSSDKGEKLSRNAKRQWITAKGVYKGERLIMTTNIPFVRIEGFEALTSYTFAKGPALKLTYSHAVPKDNKGRYVTRARGDKVTFSADWDIEQQGLYLVWRSIFTMDFHGNPGRLKKGYNTHDIYLSWRPQQKGLDRFSVDFGISNIFDEAYSAHASRSSSSKNKYHDYAQGRNIKISLGIIF